MRAAYTGLLSGPVTESSLEQGPDCASVAGRSSDGGCGCAGCCVCAASIKMLLSTSRVSEQVMQGIFRIRCFDYNEASSRCDFANANSSRIAAVTASGCSRELLWPATGMVTTP